MWVNESPGKHYTSNNVPRCALRPNVSLTYFAKISFYIGMSWRCRNIFIQTCPSSWWSVRVCPDFTIGLFVKMSLLRSSCICWYLSGKFCFRATAPSNATEPPIECPVVTIAKSGWRPCCWDTIAIISKAIESHLIIRSIWVCRGSSRAKGILTRPKIRHALAFLL